MEFTECFIAYPILNGETNEYMGLVSASIPTVDFFSRFGNVYDVQSQYLIALDRNANYLTHGNRELVGKNFLKRPHEILLREVQL